ncbi:lipid-A-disaccharide synthase [Candidatus Obscuribacterales bacterium]|nr:lipid-A-disaccharide synthase [Candidatus Obscuribacterales bacterium]
MNGPQEQSRPRPQSIFILAGDQSGDNHAAPIVERLKSLNPDLHIWGVGGPRLKAAGMDVLHDYRDFAVFGFQHVIGKLVFFRSLIAQMVSLIRERKPALLLLVDYGAVSLRIARTLRKSLPGLAIYQFISPQIWASRPWRAKTIKESNIRMLVIFPFEEVLCRKIGISSKFVGHPLTKHLAQTANRTKETFRDFVGLNAKNPIVAIFPGSRPQEISYILPPSLEAISFLQTTTHPDIQFVISVAEPSLEVKINKCIEQSGLRANQNKNLFLLPSSENHNLMSHCDMAWAKSGTTTLEVALFGKPMLIYYRGSLLDYLVVSLFKTTKLVGMPNILAGQELVPELLQNDCNPGLIARITRQILDNPAVRQNMSDKLLGLRHQLGSLDYVSECVEELIVSLSQPSNPI